MIRKLLGLAIGALLIAGCQSNTLTADWQRIDPPVEAPDFTLPQLSGEPVSLRALRGRVVIMDFWATWCPPCRQSMPSLEHVYRQYRDKGATVLMVNVGESVDVIKQWTAGRYSAPILLDEQREVQQRYGVDGLPRLFVIDRQGRLVYAHSGYGGGLEHSLGLVLRELLADGRSDAR